MRKDSEHYRACDFCFNSDVHRSGMYLVLSKVRRPVDRGILALCYFQCWPTK